MTLIRGMNGRFFKSVVINHQLIHNISIIILDQRSRYPEKVSDMQINELYRKKLDDALRIALVETRLQRLMRNPFKPIFKKSIDWITNKFQLPLTVKVKTFWDDDFYIIPPELSSSFTLRFGFWEEDVAMMLIKYLSEGKVFFDVGAHLGYFTLMGSRLVGDKGQVHAFEPAQMAFNMLQKNVKQCKNCHLNNVGIFSSEKMLEFNDYGLKLSIYNSFYDFVDDKNKIKDAIPNKYYVKTMSIDQYCAQNNIYPDVIKIDAESSELEILYGMSNLLKKHKPVMIFEIGGLQRENFDDYDRVIEYAVSYGYRPYEYIDKSFVEYNQCDITSYKNLLIIAEGNDVK